MIKTRLRKVTLPRAPVGSNGQSLCDWEWKVPFFMAHARRCGSVGRMLEWPAQSPGRSNLLQHHIQPGVVDVAEYFFNGAKDVLHLFRLHL